YYAVKGQGAFHLKDGKAVKIHANAKLTGLVVLTSVFHFNAKEKAVIEKYPSRIASYHSCGSSIKACHIAEGLAELSFRFSDGTKEWDTAASQIIVEEAGGVFVKPDLTRILYNREDVYNREGYIIANRIENVLL
ncbi:MAG: 3'(2'),5'-bisphosphate nucleotidase CysQ, partial [Firmicutes bacterium]|nr:3'(2'),5'-bisphosphate nucleotidase CysQ [Bacillota bacterium]